MEQFNGANRERRFDCTSRRFVRSGSGESLETERLNIREVTHHPDGESLRGWRSSQKRVRYVLFHFGELKHERLLIESTDRTDRSEHRR